MDPVAYKTHDAAHGGFATEEELLSVEVEPDHIIRICWCYFWHSNTAGIEAWVQMHGVDGQPVRIPAVVYPAATSYYGFATTKDNYGRVTSGNGAIYWNNSDVGSGLPMNPFPMPALRCRKVSLRGKWPATTGMQVFLGVMSVPPIQL